MMLTLTEVIYELNEMIDRCAYERDIIALTMAKEAIEAMKNIKEADDIKYVAEILKEYISGVEI